jgi:hypothetical protein
MDLSNLTLEVTRQCNMACGHCMRGETQNVSMSTEVIDALLEDVSSINSVTFTGGEPSLNIPIIRYFLEQCKRYRIEIGYFYIATNGKRVTDEFISVLMDLYIYCDDGEDGFNRLEVSRSQWHELEGQDEDGIERLKVLRFASEREKLTDSNILVNDGRATYYGGREIVEVDEIDINDCLYINAMGDVILTDGNISYESQEDRKAVNILETPLLGLINKLEAVIALEEAA